MSHRKPNQCTARPDTWLVQKSVAGIGTDVGREVKGSMKYKMDSGIIKDGSR